MSLSLHVNLGPRSYDIAITTADAAGFGPFARVTAPFNGVVTSRDVDIGTLITAGNKEMFKVAKIEKSMAARRPLHSAAEP